MPGLVGLALVYAADSGPPYLVATADPSKPMAELYELGATAARPLPGGDKVTGLPLRAAGARLVFATAEGGVTVRAPNGTTTVHRGLAPTVSADGSSLAFVSREGGDWTIRYGRVGAEPAVLVRSPRPLAAPTISPDGALLAYQGMPREDWELYTIPTTGGESRRLTYEIQHDIVPQFLSGGRVLAVMGEGRHRRSYLYDATTGVRTRFFHNNTVRTIAPEYEWVPRPDGQVVAIVSDRDGDTVSPERGLYITDLRRTVSAEEVLGRVRESLQAERELRQRGTAMFAPVSTRVKGLVSEISSSRIYDYARSLYGFGSKHVTQPGNQRAIAYLQATLRSFGYEPELQWFEPTPGFRSANVVVTIRGTVNPEVQYVVGSHFDSVQEGPGSDDNTSGTTASARGRPGPGASAPGGDHPPGVVHRGGIGTAGQQGVRPGGPGRGRPGGRCAQQRHGGLGQRRPARQHDPLFQRRAARPAARRGFPLHQPDHVRRALLQVHRRPLTVRRLRRRGRRHRLLSRPGESRTTTSRTTSWRRSTTASSRR